MSFINPENLEADDRLADALLEAPELDLQRWRLRARLTLSALGKHLGMHVAQVSRYEKRPYDAPFRIVTAWITTCRNSAGTPSAP